MTWIVETLDQEVDDELEALAADVRARFVRIAQMIEAVGLENMREPHVKHLKDKLWEIRIKGRDGVARAIYVTARPRRVVVLRAFVKKTQKTPKREIELAQRRAARVER